LFSRLTFIIYILAHKSINQILITMSRVQALVVRLVALLFISFFTPFISASQFDSLKIVLNKRSLDTSTINELNSYTLQLVIQNNDEVKFFLDHLLQLTDSIRYTKGQANANYNYYFFNKMQGNYPEALNYVLKAMSYFTIIKDYNGLVASNKGAGIMYMYNRKLDEASVYFKTALKLSIDHVNTEIGDSYNNLGFLYMGINKYDEAFNFYEKSVKYHKKYGNEIGLGKALTNMGVICRDKKETKKAIYYLNEAKKYFDQNNLTWGQILVYINIGICQSIDGNYKDAIINQNIALELASKAGDKENLANAYYGLYESYKAMGDYKLALLNFEKLSQIKDTVFNEESNKKLNELHAKYENEKKENEIRLLKQENKIKKLELAQKKNEVIISYGILVLLIIGGILSYIYYRNRQVQKLRETVLHTEITERTRIAKDMHDELGASLTKILIVSEVAKNNLNKQELVAENIKTINSTVKDLSSNIRDFVWTLNPENATLENLSIKLREFCSDIFDEAKIDAHINIQEDLPLIELSKKAQRNIYLACKESINNVLKHAGSEKATFELFFNTEKLVISISDYGKGFDMATLKTTGHGLRNIIKRIEDIGGLANIDSAPNKGTVARFEIDVKQLS
jgi:signal transduction histidine kinase